MSNISTVYDTLISKMGTLLPDHLRLSDPLRMEKNTYSELRQGYGLRISPGENTNQQLSCRMMLSRVFTIVLTRSVQGKSVDRDKKALAEKQLMEDLFILIDDFESEPKLGSSVIVGTDYLNDGGIELPENTRDDVIMNLSTWRIRYEEDFN